MTSVYILAEYHMPQACSWILPMNLNLQGPRQSLLLTLFRLTVAAED
jgi:hypothetical protein